LIVGDLFRKNLGDGKEEGQPADSDLEDEEDIVLDREPITAPVDYEQSNKGDVKRWDFSLFFWIGSISRSSLGSSQILVKTSWTRISWILSLWTPTRICPGLSS
jgi:hypothetical protein